MSPEVCLLLLFLRDTRRIVELLLASNS